MPGQKHQQPDKSPITKEGEAAAPFGERRLRSAAMVFPVVSGRFYRAWVDAVQAAFAQAFTGPASAVSNFMYDLDPVFFEFR